MKFSKIKCLILAIASAFFIAGTGVSAGNEAPQFDTGSILVITGTQSSDIGLFSIQSVGADLNSVLGELGITEYETLMELSENNSDGISLFSVGNVSDGGQILKLNLSVPGEEEVLRAVDALNESGAVEYAQPNYYFYQETEPDDTLYRSSYYNRYHLDKISAQSVWDMDIDCSAVNVAVLDSGLLIEHEDIAGNLWTNPLEIPGDGKDNDGNGYIDDIHGWDFTTATSSNNDPTKITDPYSPSSSEVQGHGTHVSGIISAVTNNGIGVASLARNAKIIPLRIFDDKQSCSSDVLISALSYIKKTNAAGNSIPIANCSLGAVAFGKSQVNRAVKTAFESCGDTLFTASAGNGNSIGIGQDNSKSTGYSPIYPASYGLSNIISVAASDRNDKLAVFSNYGSAVDIAAPGVNILSTRNNYNSVTAYDYLSGTSQAAPLVAGTAAVIKAKYPSLTPSEIKAAILKGADVISGLNYTEAIGTVHTINGNRRLNAYEALKWAGSPYKITWRDDSGAAADITYAEYKSMPSHTDLTKADTEEYKYTFTGWSPELDYVSGDAEYTAVFNAKKIASMITWRNYDGSIIDSGYVSVGSMPYHDEAVKDSDESYDYTFIGWEPAAERVTEDATYTAKYAATELGAKKTYIDATDVFEDKLFVQRTLTADGDALITIKAKDNAEELPDGFVAYLVCLTEEGTPESIRKIAFAGHSALIEKQENKNCRLFIWTDRNEPVINVVTDMTDFWS